MHASVLAQGEAATSSDNERGRPFLKVRDERGFLALCAMEHTVKGACTGVNITVKGA
jgi:hypothetical protein